MSDTKPNSDRPPIGPDTLLFGIGNSGRGDDGLGWAFVDQALKALAFAGRAEFRYQLQVEDAALISRAGRVVFVDSFKGELPGGFCWQPCEPSESFEFTTHVLPPRAILYYCQDLYGKTPPANALMIQGTSWELGAGLSPEAEERLQRALRFFREEILPG